MPSANLANAIGRFRKASEADPRVLAAFLGGSLAAGTADAYSDLDLYVVIADEDYANFFADRIAFLNLLGGPVHFDDFNGFGFDMVRFVLEDSTKGELSLGPASHFLHIHGGPYEVILDRADVLRGVEFP